MTAHWEIGQQKANVKTKTQSDRELRNEALLTVIDLGTLIAGSALAFMHIYIFDQF